MRMHKGKLLTCDPALKEYLVFLDKAVGGRSFLISELDSTHLFIIDSPDIAAYLQEKLDAWHDANSYSEEMADEAEATGQMPAAKQPKHKS